MHCKSKSINLMLGTACDRSCEYCLQSNGASPANKKPDLDWFCDNFKNLVSANTSISYWGGEPMIYFDKIKHIHNHLKDAGITFKRATITTHGRSLTDEYVDFANANPEIWTSVSCHGYDFADAQLKMISRLKSFSFSEIISHENLFSNSAREFAYSFEDRFGVFPHVWLHFVRANDYCDPKFYLTHEDVDLFCNHLMNDVLPMAQIGDKYSIWFLNQLQRERIKKRDKSDGAMCVNAGSLSIDLHGNIYQCHHDYSQSNIVGNAFKKIIPIYESEIKNPNRFYSTPECQKCELLNECRGGCYLSHSHKVDCYLTKRLSRVLRNVEKGYVCYFE